MSVVAAQCSGDPCADTECGPTSASAVATGSESARADASAGSDDDSDHTGPTATAAAADDEGPTSGEAFAERNWSTASASDACAEAGGATVALRGLPEGIPFPAVADLRVGCIANAEIAATESFFGRLYLGPAGVVAYDEERGEGLVLDTLRVKFTGGTLDALVPMDVAALVATNAFVGVDLVDGGHSDSCFAQLLY